MAKVKFDFTGKFNVNVLKVSDEPFDVTITKVLGPLETMPAYADLGDGVVVTQMEDVEEIEETLNNNGLIYSVMPFGFTLGSEQYILPIEPLVTVSGKNTIIRRTVAKSSVANPDKNIIGTIKERWSQDDYDISIQGVVRSVDPAIYPVDYVMILKRMYDYQSEIPVEHEILNALGITNIAIESISFPHTKGLENQNFDIKAYSDYPIDLIIKE